MTLQEFKAWFGGFTENIDKLPSQKQWKRIQERVAEIDGVAVTERVYVDRWLQPYRYSWPGQIYQTYMGGMGVGNVATNAGLGCFNTTSMEVGANTVSTDTVTLMWDNIAAMGDAGRAEAQTLLAA